MNSAQKEKLLSVEWEEGEVAVPLTEFYEGSDFVIVETFKEKNVIQAYDFTDNVILRQDSRGQIVSANIDWIKENDPESFERFQEFKKQFSFLMREYALLGQVLVGLALTTKKEWHFIEKTKEIVKSRFGFQNDIRLVPILQAYFRKKTEKAAIEQFAISLKNALCLNFTTAKLEEEVSA